MEQANPQLAQRKFSRRRIPLDRPRRGIRPDKLLALVYQTAPFALHPRPTAERQDYLRLLADTNAAVESGDLNPDSLSHEDYFHLCLAAHNATASTFVPTDVDNQIRHHLWDRTAGEEALTQMAKTTIESLQWDYQPVSKRHFSSPGRTDTLSYHEGTWFSVAVGAYAATRYHLPKVAEQVLAAIADEAERELDLFCALLEHKAGEDLIRAAAVLAHNFGDLDRVIEMWAIGEADPLRRSFYKLAHQKPADPKWRWIWAAGELNKSYVADENHRHFPLRKPKFLRQSAELLLPISPFLDAWGERLVRHPGISEEQIGEVAEALVDGFERLATIGYARALAGIESTMAGGLNAIERQIPARQAKLLRTGPLRQHISVERERFEKQWACRALKFLSQF